MHLRYSMLQMIAALWLEVSNAEEKWLFSPVHICKGISSVYLFIANTCLTTMQRNHDNECNGLNEYLDLTAALVVCVLGWNIWNKQKVFLVGSYINRLVADNSARGYYFITVNPPKNLLFLSMHTRNLTHFCFKFVLNISMFSSRLPFLPSLVMSSFSLCFVFTCPLLVYQKNYQRHKNSANSNTPEDCNINN